MHHSNTDDINPAEKGSWEPIKYRFKHLPVHIALLHTGKVLAFGGSGNDETRSNNPYPAEIFEPDHVDIIDDDHHENHGHDHNYHSDCNRENINSNSKGTVWTN